MPEYWPRLHSLVYTYWPVLNTARFWRQHFCGDLSLNVIELKRPSHTYLNESRDWGLVVQTHQESTYICIELPLEAKVIVRERALKYILDQYSTQREAWLLKIAVSAVGLSLPTLTFAWGQCGERDWRPGSVQHSCWQGLTSASSSRFCQRGQHCPCWVLVLYLDWGPQLSMENHW